MCLECVVFLVRCLVHGCEDGASVLTEIQNYIDERGKRD